ncbi:MAG: L-rhamnose isomerase [Promethearchaeota archaeon]
MNDKKIINAYNQAQEFFEEFGINTDTVLKQLQSYSISIHCWQGDDVGGFETPESELKGGGIQVTGNYPGKARSISELQQDLEKVLSLIPGNHGINLHASYGDFGGKRVDRDQISIDHFQNWIEWAKALGIHLDFNCTLFSHPKAENGFTLTSNDKEIRAFWINHVKRCREISAEIGKQLNHVCVHNIWIPDGMKDIPIDRMKYRKVLKDSLDEIFTKKFPKQYMRDSLEGKLFGIGSESYVVGSHDFYLSYAISNKTLITFDTGHYHPTESIADKISAVLPFVDGIVLHLSRGVRWDSDHIVILDDIIIQIMEEIVKCNASDKIFICTDWFDASINRIGAYVIGLRAILKALLMALLKPWDQLREYEEEGDYTRRLALLEDLKTVPHGAIWNYYCHEMHVPLDFEWIHDIKKYEKDVLLKRR